MSIDFLAGEQPDTPALFRHPGALGRQWIERADGTIQQVGGRDSVQVDAGDVFVVETPGGGGYGVPE